MMSYVPLRPFLSLVQEETYKGLTKFFRESGLVYIYMNSKYILNG